MTDTKHSAVEREAFEAYCHDKHPIGRTGDFYNNSATQEAWIIWQAARAAIAAAAPSPVPLFDRKLADLQQRGYQVIGRILHKDGEYALFDSSCRWLTRPQYQRLMHEQDGSLFAAPKAALTDGQINDAYREFLKNGGNYMVFARRIEAASGPNAALVEALQLLLNCDKRNSFGSRVHAVNKAAAALAAAGVTTP